jgi:hypothetical protein
MLSLRSLARLTPRLLATARYSPSAHLISTTPNPQRELHTFFVDSSSACSQLTVDLSRTALRHFSSALVLRASQAYARQQEVEDSDDIVVKPAAPKLYASIENSLHAPVYRAVTDR